MITPLTRNSVSEMESLPRHAGEIPTTQVKLPDPQVAYFASWVDDQLTDLEWRFRDFWTTESTATALFQGSKRR